MRKSTVFVSVSLLAALTLGCKEEPKAKPTAARASREPSAPAASAPAPVRERPTLKSDGQSADEGSGESAPGEGAQAFPDRGQWKAGDRTAFDTNGDGRLDQEEREAMHKARIEDTLKKLDSNGDGAISEAELDNSDERTARRVRRRFERYDLDKDGSISREELEQGMKMRRRFNEGERRGGRGPGGWGDRPPRPDR